jgi:hypothetical protein
MINVMPQKYKCLWIWGNIFSRATIGCLKIMQTMNGAPELHTALPGNRKAVT